MCKCEFIKDMNLKNGQLLIFCFAQINRYFEKTAFKEVLAEFTPMLCPTSPKMVFGLEMLKHFIPFLDRDSEDDINNFMKQMLSYCEAWNNGPAWEWVKSHFKITKIS